MAPKMKLYFFPARARVEVLRLMLAAAKVDYEMVSYTMEEWQQTYKKQMPWGKCPVLEIDGKKYGETMAIAGYLAEEYGFHGSSSMDRMVITQLLCKKDEALTLEGIPFHESDPQRKAELTKDLYDNQFPRLLQIFTDFIKEYSNGKDFVLGEKLSVGDFCIHAATTTLAQERPDILEKYPEVLRLRNKVSEVDGVKEYLATRTVTPI